MAVKIKTVHGLHGNVMSYGPSNTAVLNLGQPVGGGLSLVSMELWHTLHECELKLCFHLFHTCSALYKANKTCILAHDDFISSTKHMNEMTVVIIY